MNTKAAGRKVKMFRTHIDPMVKHKGTPQLAHMCDALNMDAFINDEATGILVLNREKGSEHFIFSANIQSLELYPEERPKLKGVKSGAV